VKDKFFQVKIRPLVLTLLILLISSVVVVTISLQYYFQQDLALNATKDNFKHISQKVEQNIKSIDDRSNSIISMMEMYDIVQKEPSKDKQHPLLPIITNTIKNNSFIYAIYVGHKNGNFYEIINLDINKDLKRKYKVDLKTKWLVIKIATQNGQRIQYEDFLDHNFNIMKQTKRVAVYNPSIRPWYKEATRNQGIIKTAPYMFANLEEHGITYAKQIKNSTSVLALDISLQSLSDYLKKQQITNEHEIYLYRNQGDITATTIKEEKEVDYKNSKPIFNKKELEFIQSKPTIKVSNENNYAPFDFLVSKEPTGYTIDLLKLISFKSNLNFTYINGYTWDELLQLFKDKKIDIIHTISKNRERKDMGIFSSSFVNMKIKLLINKNTKNIKSLEDMKEKTLAVVKGFDIEEFIKKNYPNINIKYVNNSIEALKLLSQQKVDAFIERDLIAEYLMKQQSIDGIVFISDIKKLNEPQNQSLHFLTQSNKAELASIIEKSLQSITKKEYSILNKKWFSDRIKIEKIPHKEVLELIKNQNTDQEIVNINGKNYFVYISKIQSIYKTKESLAMLIPIDFIMEEYTNRILFAFFITLGILTFTIPLIWYSTKLLSSPIKHLSIENEKIRNRDFDNVKNIVTYVKELDDLSLSLVTMAHSIKSYQNSQKELLNSFTQILASAIDAKSKYTGKHCKRVPTIAMMLAKEAHLSDDHAFKDFKIENEDQERELSIAAWLHDCGKVTTPEYVIDKATKLETIYNRIHEVRTRFEVIHRDLTIQALKNILNGSDEKEEYDKLLEEHNKLYKEFEIIAEANIGSEFMNDEDIQKLHEIAKRTWVRHFDDTLGISIEEKLKLPEDKDYSLPKEEKLLSDKKEHIIPRVNFYEEEYKSHNFKVEVPDNLYNLGELYNLSVKKGTLTKEERFKIKEHIMVTIIMLERLPFPKHLKNVPEYAGSHHETPIGTGYPRKLKKEDMSIPARILAIADVFEALTSSDRPYKKGKKLSESIEILSKMAKKQEIDPDIFRLFLEKKVYKNYGNEFLSKEQNDEIDISKYI